MSSTWILVAHDAGARLFEREAAGKKIQLLQQFDFPKGKKREREINADKPGRSYDSSGAQRHAMGHEVSPHHHGEEVFAHELAGFLEKALAQQRFARLVLVAPPHFLGTLRKALSDNLGKVIVAQLAKDFPAYLGEAELISRLEAEIQT